MIKIKALAFVGIPVTDMKRARTFYEDVLGLKASGEMMSGKWVEYSLGNNTLAIASVGPQWLPSDQGTRARVLSGNPRAKTGANANGRSVGRVRFWPNHHWGWVSPGLATVARWNDSCL